MSDELILRVGGLKLLSDRAKKAYDAARAELEHEMGRGDRRIAYSPIDKTKIAAVSMSDPKTTARVADEKAFGAWAATHYPDDIEWDFDVIGSHQEVVAVLYDHAPHLLRRVSKVSPELVKSVTHASAQTGEATGPNGELDVPGVAVETKAAVVSCLPADGGWAAVLELVRAGHMPLELLAAPTEGAA